VRLVISVISTSNIHLSSRMPMADGEELSKEDREN
jgi:hypothetical protein